jgi:hypothetical protein
MDEGQRQSEGRRWDWPIGRTRAGMRGCCRPGRGEAVVVCGGDGGGGGVVLTCLQDGSVDGVGLSRVSLGAGFSS